MDAVEILKKLISFPTNTTFYDNRIKGYILSLLKNQISEVKNIPKTKNRSFVIKIRDSQAKKRPLVFLCHLDTVTPSNQWLFDPYTPTIKNSKLFGLGASDMKGSVAALLKSVLELKKINRPTYLAFTSDEETTVNDIKELTREIVFNEAIVIALEPTEGKIRVGQKGVLELRITISGVSHHASKATRRLNKKDNAIYKMGSVINYIKKYETSIFNKRYPNKVTFNFGKIEGGIAVNCMAENCFLEISCRFDPSVSSKELYKKIKADIEKVDNTAKIKLLLLGDSFSNKNKKDINHLKNIVVAVGKYVGAYR